MKTLALSAAILLSATLASAQPPIGATAPLDREIAIVERTAIWQSQLDEVIATIPAKQFDPTQKQRIVETLIDAVLIDHTSELLHLMATPEEIDNAIASVKQENKIDDATFQKALADQGYTMESYRVALAQQIRAQKVFQVEVAPKIAISDDEVNAEWAKHSKDKITTEQREAVRRELWSMRMQASTQDWIAKRRAGAHIEVRP